MRFNCKPKGNVSGSVRRPLTRCMASTASSCIPITDEQTKRWKDAYQNRVTPEMHAQTTSLATAETCINPKTEPRTITEIPWTISCQKHHSSCSYKNAPAGQAWMKERNGTCHASSQLYHWTYSQGISGMNQPSTCHIQGEAIEYGNIVDMRGKNWWQNNGVPTTSRFARSLIIPLLEVDGHISLRSPQTL